MNFLQTVRENRQKVNFSICEELRVLSPQQSEYKIAMGVFDQEKLINSILINLCCHGLYVDNELVDDLLNYFSRNFETETEKTGLQIFMNFSKSDFDVLYDKYCEDHGNLCSKTDYFNSEMKSFLEKLMVLKENLVQEAPAEVVLTVKEGLKREPCLLAIQQSLSKVLDGKNTSIEVIRDNIDSINIYGMDSFPPLPTMRGSSLINGFCYNWSQIADQSIKQLADADVITLGLHEVTNYLNRLLMNNFNTSTPIRSLGTLHDTEYPELKMELGCESELLLFGGKQPEWLASRIKAADLFLERLKTYKTIPIIRFPEYNSIKLKPRAKRNISMASGIDTLDSHPILC